MAVEVNTFNDFSVASQEKYPLISNMSFMLKPQVGADLFDVNPMETDIGEMMKMGLMKEVLGEEIIHHEANKRFDAPLVNQSETVGNVYGVAAAPVDPAGYVGLDYVQISRFSHSPQTGTNQWKYSYPRVGNIIQFKNLGTWRIAGKKESAAGEHRIYLTKVNAAQPALSATITSAGGVYGGDQFSVFTNAFEEATYGMTTGLVPTTKTYTNYVQIFSDYYDVTNVQERNETYPLKWHGEVINFVYEKGISDTELRFGLQEDFGVFITPKDDGTMVTYDATSGSTGKAVGTTQAYIPNLEINAPKVYWDNNPTIALFEQLIRLRRKLHQGKDCMLQYGYEFGLRAKDIITQFGVNGSMVYNRKDVDLNINTIRIGGFNFNMKELAILNHPDVTAIQGFPYPYYFIIAPMDKMKDPKTNIMRDAFCIMYKKQVGAGARGHYKIWSTGANSPGGTDAQMVRRIHLASQKGMQVVGASKFIFGKKLTS